MVITRHRAAGALIDDLVEMRRKIRFHSSRFFRDRAGPEKTAALMRMAAAIILVACPQTRISMLLISCSQRRV